MFDAQIDTTYAVLEKTGFGKTEVIVSETDGVFRGDANGLGASAKIAKTCNSNLRKRLLKKGFVLALYARFLWDAEEDEDEEEETDKGENLYDSGANRFEGSSGWMRVTAT
ncbi:hypothetical protein POM88_051471 [Heracleum sosnowskyi]|uniref:Uncharacterized protein n=1 Tax=Heracleum sosnowskyi TaxID=360622 RepID=A0AAD8M1A6_9APIA|nr:hypothetical protein POM88_051471 [Heracleum sosnowskyi]